MKSSTRGVSGPSSGVPKAMPASMSLSRTGSSSESTKASPRRAKSMPRVAMNELMPTTTTKKALMAPMMRPVARAARMPSQISGMLAITTPETARVLATLRSSSPMRMTAVRPSATRPMSATRPSVTWYEVNTTGSRIAAAMMTTVRRARPRPSVRRASVTRSCVRKPPRAAPSCMVCGVASGALPGCGVSVCWLISWPPFAREHRQRPRPR